MFAHERLYEESLITDEGEAGIHPCCRLILLDVKVGVPGQSVALRQQVMYNSVSQQLILPQSPGEGQWQCLSIARVQE